MNKVVSIVAAVLLGLAVMSIPALLFFSAVSHEFKTSENEGIIQRIGRQIEALRTQGRIEGEVVRFPSSLLYAGLIVLLASIFALAIYVAVLKSGVEFREGSAFFPSSLR